MKRPRPKRAVKLLALAVAGAIMLSTLEKSSPGGSSCRDDAQMVRQSVLKLQPYVPGKPIEEVKRELGLPDDFSVIKLASNENVLGPSPQAVAAMQKAAQDVWLYPDDTCFELKNALANYWDLTPGHFIIGNGSDEVIHFLSLAFLDSARGDEVIFGAPSFVQYKAAAMIADCAFHAVPLDGAMKHDLPAMKAKVNDNTRLIFVCTPNNPTGTTISKGEFDDFLWDLPPHVVVVLDEAYAEYAVGDAPRARDYIDNHNVIGLRTFSKAYGIAGTRVGYGLARPELIHFLQQVRGPFNVNTLAQVAAIAALGDQDHIRNSVEINAQGRAQLQGAFEAMGLEFIPSQANFVLVNIGIDAAASFNELLKRGVIVRTGTPFGLDTWLRVTVGTAPMNERFIAALREITHS